MTIGLGVLVVLALANLALLGVVLYRSASGPVERAVRDELRQSRDDVGKQSRDLRDELRQGMKSSTDTLVNAVGELGGLQTGQLDTFGTQLAAFNQSTQERLDGIWSVVESQLAEMRNANDTRFNELRTTVESSLRSNADDSGKAAQALREEVTNRLTTFQEAVQKRYDAMRQTVDEKLQATQDQTATASTDSTKAAQALRDEVTNRLTAFQESVDCRSTAMRKTVEEKLQAVQDHTTKASRELREELAATLKGNTESIGQQLKTFGETMHSRLDAVKGAVESQLKDIQESNSKKLDEIRKTVDEQLQNTLEKRLTESFKVVSAHLDSVQQGLGKMQTLAEDVGDLQRVLTNVKTRGTWAEVQLGAILEQVLTPEQYAENVQTRDDSREHVEYAVRLPGRDGDGASCVWLPIDSKFPQESYVRLVDAAQAADAAGVEQATADLARALRSSAQDIRDKYLAPPKTTDFAILFLPTEGLYAEVLRQRDLANELQQTYRVMVAGPTTLAALLNSLRLGFKTLSIQQHASEVWRVLAAVKTEFGKFGGVLDKLRRQLDLATRTIDLTDRRTRAMERRLRDVEELPPGIVAADILRLPDAVEPFDDDELHLLDEDAEPQGV